VLERRDFVEAAPALPADPRIRLPPASPRRCDGKETKVFHLHSEQQRLVAHHQDLRVLPPRLPPRPPPQQRYCARDNEKDQLQAHKPKIIPRLGKRGGQRSAQEHPARWHGFSAPTGCLAGDLERDGALDGGGADGLGPVVGADYSSALVSAVNEILGTHRPDQRVPQSSVASEKLLVSGYGRVLARHTPRKTPGQQP
jgi:hypothetical protein